MALLAALAVIGVGTPVGAVPEDSDPQKDPPREQPEKRPEKDAKERPPAEPNGQLRVLATGLDNPRGIVAKGKGKVFVAEAGRGGDTLVPVSMGDEEGAICIGMTGAITKVHRGNVQRIRSVVSAADAVDGACDGPEVGIAATGPHGITNRHRLTYSIGLGAPPEARDAVAAGLPAAADFGTVQHIKRPRAVSADLAAFEGAVDPDMQGADSNPYGLTRLRGGDVLATDAGGNSLLRIGKDGSIDVVAVFAPRCVAWELPFPNPIPPEVNPCGDQALFPADAVPTDVAVDGNGDYLVSTLGGFPFNVGDSRVWRVDADHAGVAVCSDFPGVPGTGCDVFADGLTSLVGIDVDKAGRVYVVQFSDAGVLAAEEQVPGGEIGSVRVLHPTTGAEIGAIEGLVLPGGVDVHRHGVYITNFSIFPGLGEVVRAPVHCDRPAKCAAWHS